MTTTVDTLVFTSWTIAWTLAGGIGGYLLGRLTRDVHRLANPTLEGERVPEPAVETPRRPRRWRPGPQLLVGLLVVLLGVGTAVQGVVVSNRVEHLQQCQARYSNRFADAIDARTDTSNNSQQALDDLVNTIGKNLGGNGKANQAAISRALRQYMAQRAKTKQQRAKHPYPEPPREACG